MNVMRRLKSIASGRSSVSDPGGDLNLKRAKVEQEVDHMVDGETQSEECCSIVNKQDVSSKSKRSTASTLNVDNELPKELNEMKIKDEKSDDHEDDTKDTEPAVVSGNGTETGQIIVTTMSGRNGEKKQTLSYMAERVVGTGSFGVVFQAKCLETGESVAIKKVLQDRRYKNRELQMMRMLEHPNVVKLRQPQLNKSRNDKAIGRIRNR